MITFGELKAKCVSAIGTCSDTKASELAIAALKYLSNQGAFGELKKWRIYACDCWITLPQDMDTPKKVSVNGNPRPVQNFWHEFNDVHSIDSKDIHSRFSCDSAGGGIRIEPNVFATAYDMPKCGGYVYFAPISIPGSPLYIEKEGITGIIHGKEYSTGAEINIAHDNKLRRGEVLSIANNDFPKSSVGYSEITNVIKPQTLNRIGLYWENNGEIGLLGEYDPFETRGRFRRAYIEPMAKDYNNCCVCLTVLGTIRIKEYYDDNELLPFDSAVDYTLVLKSLNGIINANNSDEMNVAIRQKQLVDDNIVKDWDKKTSPFSPVNVVNFKKRKEGRRR